MVHTPQGMKIYYAHKLRPQVSEMASSEDGTATKVVITGQFMHETNTFSKFTTDVVSAKCQRKRMHPHLHAVSTNVLISVLYVLALAQHNRPGLWAHRTHVPSSAVVPTPPPRTLPTKYC
jgi:hypothetical protein